jgi:hypothetical protein
VTNQLPRERLAYLTRRIHSLGERPLYEFLREIEAGPRRSAQGCTRGTPGLRSHPAALDSANARRHQQAHVHTRAKAGAHAPQP